MKSGKIYLIRHGQTEGNGHHYVGWENLNLNENGKSQALAIANLLRNRPVTDIYCSSLRRAIDTATPLSKQKQLILKTDYTLNEINYGTFQGRLKSELNLKLKKEYQYQSLPDGESLHDVYLRVKKFHHSITGSLMRSENLAIISHYWSIRLFYGILQNKNFAEIFAQRSYKPDNASVYEVAYRWQDSIGLECTSVGYVTH